MVLLQLTMNIIIVSAVISCFHNEYEDDDDEIISDGDVTYMYI
jgi:hypothetical protein